MKKCPDRIQKNRQSKKPPLQIFSVLEYNDYLYSCPRLTNNDLDTDEDENADEDSNDENNWRNDYPDEEDSDGDSVGASQMRRCVERLDMGKFLMWLNIINNPWEILENARNPLLKNKFFYRLP